MAPRLSRRKLLTVGVVLGATGAAAAVAARVRSRGYLVPAGVRLASLEAWQWIVVRDMARHVCAPDRDDVVTPDQVDVAGFVDAYAAKMPPRMRRDLGRFLGFVEQLAPLRIRSASRFSRLAPADQVRVLEALESSDNDLLRGGFDGIKSLLFMGYYRDPRTWSILGYDGPLVGRPEGGWR